MTKKPTTAQEEKSEGIVAKAKAFRNYLELSKTCLLYTSDAADEL